MFKRDNLEYEFLPPALEIEETPASPLGRLTIWMIFSVIILAIVWAYIGKIDEVANARGKVIPVGKVKVIQPLELSTISQIHVTEGQKVKKGQLLIEFDSTANQAGLDSVQKLYNITRLEREILIDEMKGYKISKNFNRFGVSQDTYAFEMKSMETREQQYNSKFSASELIIKQKMEELASANSQFKINEKSLNDAKKDEQKAKALYDQAGISRDDYDEKADALMQCQSQYDISVSNIKKAKESLEEEKSNLAALKKERENYLLSQIIDRESRITELEAQIVKNNELYESEKLYSPVDGIVLGMAVNTLGGVVTPAQQLMTIVPSNTSLVIEANVSNSDIGFIKVNQKAEVKIDTFPFQRYGTVKGKVIYVSPDAVQDQKLGSIYKVKVKMNKTKMLVGGRYVNITPGMTATIEIKTGKRRILQFFLDPFMKNAKDSLKLR